MHILKLAFFSSLSLVCFQTTTAHSETSQSGKLTDEDWVTIFGSDLPSKIGPHEILYLSPDEAKKMKGKVAPVVIVGVSAAGGAIVGGTQAYLSGASWGDVARGAASGAMGGAYAAAGGIAGAAGRVGARAAAGGLWGVQMGGAYGQPGGQLTCNSKCHQRK